MKLTNVQKQSPKKTTTNVKTTKKIDKTVSFVDNKCGETKENNKLPKRKEDAYNNKKKVTTKPDSNLVNEIQVSDTDSNMAIGEDDDFVGWRSLPEILGSSNEGNTFDSDDEE